MAKVKNISTQIIKSLAGVVDFYYWKGIPVARSWPKRSSVSTSPNVLASRQAFIDSRIDLKQVTGVVRLAWAQSAHGVTEAWLDYYTHQYMRYWRDYGVSAPVVIDYTITEN